MKLRRKIFSGSVVLLLLLMGLAQSAMAAQKLLAVPLRVQAQDQWCWAGCSNAVLKYYTKAIKQCYLANFAWKRKDCCRTPAKCNASNAMYGTAGSLQAILNHWCISSSPLAKALTFAQCRSQINNNRPFILRYGWDSGGGHVIVGRGYKTDTPGYLYLMDPWPGNGYGTFTYSYVKKKAGHHEWTHTLRGVKRDLAPANWKVTSTSPVKSGDEWKYRLSLTETANGCGRLVKFYHDFYDENGKFISRQTSPPSDFPDWFDDCADKDIQFPRKTKFCGDTWTRLGGRTSGYVRHSFVIKCDSGTKITRRKKIALSGGAGGRETISIEKGFGIPASGPIGENVGPAEK